ncbi:MAG TPA: helix-turn-helix domain-containing protein [Gemmatimonadaceae bacterium]|nr:helix-turn-helix domain-containing protein [Gemmatimonadaceae bacterium]
MLGRSYDREVCSAARALEIAGERWSLLILRNAAFAGMTRFGEFQASLGVAPNVLAARLARFVEDGLMTATPAESGYAEYHLTEKGLDFKPVLVALTEWGDRWAAPDGAPIAYEHAGCGGRVSTRLACDRCAAALDVPEVIARPTAAMARARQRRRRGARGTAEPRGHEGTKNGARREA